MTEELIFEGVEYVMDSSNGELYGPGTNKKIGKWEANYGYSFLYNCEGFVTWYNYRDKERNDQKVLSQKKDI